MRHTLILAAAAAAALAAATPAAAREFTLIYTGAFSAADTLVPSAGGGDLLTASTPFRWVARFDDTSPNLVPPFLPPFVRQGFRAYRPSAATLTIGGVAYDQGPGEDWAVAFFDPTNGIFPGFYGVGWIDEADLPPGVGDGPGVIGDWAGSSPEWTADALVPFTMTGFRGAGFSSGPGCPMACTVSPFTLVGPGGLPHVLTIAFGNREAADGEFQSAVLVPAPPALALFGLALAALLTTRRR